MLLPVVHVYILKTLFLPQKTKNSLCIYLFIYYTLAGLRMKFEFTGSNQILEFIFLNKN